MVGINGITWKPICSKEVMKYNVKKEVGVRYNNGYYIKLGGRRLPIKVVSEEEYNNTEGDIIS
jgi:hypothetical protein